MRLYIATQTSVRCLWVITRSKAESLAELVMCGHSLGAGVAALLGLVSQIRYYDNPCP